jgi:predicted transcriptional regulator
MEKEQLVVLTTDIVAAHVANNNVAVGDIGNLVQRVHEALAALGAPAEEVPQEKRPLVSIRASVKPDYIVCMECGRRQKTLKRHLMTAHGMTPDQYRKDYGLPGEYPMTAPDYSQRRSEMAQAIGLGRKGKGGGGGAGASRRERGMLPSRTGKPLRASAAGKASQRLISRRILRSGSNDHRSRNASANRPHRARQAAAAWCPAPTAGSSTLH